METISSRHDGFGGGVAKRELKILSKTKKEKDAKSALVYGHGKSIYVGLGAAFRTLFIRGDENFSGNQMYSS